MKILIKILWFFFLQIVLLSAKNKLTFEQISIDEGISQSIVICILEDHRGFLWIGTQDGLNKYDGYKFTHYKNNPSDSNTILDNYISALYEDTDKNLWIGTYGGGLNKYNLVTETFTHFKTDINDKNSIADNYITAIAEDDDNNIWVGTINNGLSRYNKLQNKFEVFQKDSIFQSTIPSNYVTTLFYDKNKNVLWIGTFDGISYINLNTNKFTDLSNLIFNQFSKKSKRIRSFLVDSKDQLWIGTDTEGVIKIESPDYRLGLIEENLTRYKSNPSIKGTISGNSINAICETKKGNIVFGVWGGGINILHDDQSINKFVTYSQDDSDPTSLSEDDVISIIEDNSGVIWIGTYGGGLNKVNPHAENFTHYSNNPSVSNTLVHNRVFAITRDKNNLWLGTWDGLNRLNTSTGKYSLFKYGEKNSISDNRITSLVNGQDGSLWIGTLDGGLNKYEKSLKKFSNYRHDENNPFSLCNDRVISLLKRKNGELWIGSLDEGLCVYNKSKDIFNPLPELNAALSNFRIRVMFEDTDGLIWIGTYNGLNLYDPNKNKLLDICENLTAEHPIRNTRITSVNQTKNKEIWVGTFGSGVYKLTPDVSGNCGYTSTHYHEANGLPNDFIYAILVDNEDNVWFSTNKGISKYNNELKIFQNFGAFEGLEFEEFKDGAFYDKNSGKMYFGGIDGFVEFSPDNLEINYKIPEVIFTELRIYNKVAKISENSPLVKTISETDTLYLTYDENSIALEFTAANFIAPKSITYEYILDSYDKEYSRTSAEYRVATYTNLPGGTYTFRVKAYLSSQQKDSREKELTIIVIPPYWDTTWFKVSAIFILTAFIIFGVMWRLHRIKQRNIELENEVKSRTKELEEINAAKDRFFSVIAHDLKNPFSYLLSNSELLAKEIKVLSPDDTYHLATNINNAASNLFNLLENLLQWSKYQMMGIKPKFEEFSFSELVEQNILLLHHLAKQKRISLSSDIKCSKNISSDYNVLDTVIRNLISNSIKFTPENGSIVIKGNCNEHELIFSVHDSGIGMEQEEIDKIFLMANNKSTAGTNEEKGTGLGLVLCKDFIAALNGSISVESIKGAGTKITCKIPFIND